MMGYGRRETVDDRRIEHAQSQVNILALCVLTKNTVSETDLSIIPSFHPDPMDKVVAL